MRRAVVALSLASLSVVTFRPAFAQSAPGAPGTSQTIPEKVQPKLDTTPAPSAAHPVGGKETSAPSSRAEKELLQALQKLS
jgi:hypothetical protein